MSELSTHTAPGHRSGFVAVVGRPNAGKSTLVNRLVGEKVSIVSDKPQTTRFPIRAVLTRPDAQLVFVDTPGIHKPRTAFGTRMNNVARDSYDGVDVVVLVVDACEKIGSGDQRLAAELGPSTIVAMNKSDRANHATIAAQLAAAAAWDFAEYFPISARTGDGVDELLEAIIALLHEGPQLYPADHVTDTAESVWIAELVREQLLAVTRQELPHSIHTQVVERDGPRIRCEILVERESQKPMVIGKGGAVLKEVGIRARAQLPEGTFLELHVKVEPRWQRRPDIFDRIGLDTLEGEMP